MQLIAYATYSDGSTGTLPDAQGNKVTWWNTTNHTVAKISRRGLCYSVGGGFDQHGGHGRCPDVVSPWPVTVGPAVPRLLLPRLLLRLLLPGKARG